MFLWTFGFGKFIANGDDAVEVIEENVGEFRVEMFAAFILEEVENFFESPCFFVDAFDPECVEDVGDTSDPAVDMDAFSFEPLWVAASVKFFVVLVCDEGGGL